ncbi:hypothetical protein RvY_12412 [Ramazzottius varieornatus]|uniref:Uncharacterized protein n=1 Tax=Ramazzottius varieornatus TaxID=947166 RepID=A0A1D1VNM4_RAMVA|nr:hypothetical protein RvY_12412 [Ramazzottius varieornatus]
MLRISSSSICLVSLGVVLLAILYWPGPSLAKGVGGRGGGGGGGRASGGFGGRSSSSARSSYGAAARTSSSRTASSSSAVRSTAYGSSAPSGYSSGSGYGASGRVGSASGTAYRGSSSTYNRVAASPGTARASAAARPQVHTPTAAKSQPTPVVYSPTYNSYYGGGMGAGGFGGRSSSGASSLLLAGGAGLIGGYYMGRMMGSLYHPYGYGYGGYGYSPYQSYVPYRDQYGQYYATTTPSPLISGNQAVTPAVKKELDLCTLARWNRELPFTELPNMALQFLMNDSVSGISTIDKAKFLQGFFKNASEGYKTYNSSADIFTIPATYDLTICNFQNAADVDVTKTVSSGTVEEPLITALRAIIQQYANSADLHGLADVVTAAKACLPRPRGEGQPPTNLQVLPCLDYSLSPDQLMKLDKPQSVFGNEEVCHRQLNPDMFKCIPDTDDQGGCTQEHLVALNVFARNYYLCAKELDDDTLHKLQAQGGQVSSGGGSWWSSPATATSGGGPLILLLLSFVTLLISALLS